MAELTRNIDTVTAEIVMIRDNAKRVFFDAVIQIGRRLEEAKALVPQGEWLRYLDTCLGFKPSTAQNYMRIAREMGDGQLGLDGKAAADMFGQLGYTQLLPMLGLTDEERRELAEDNDLAGMSSREVKKLVEDYKAAKSAAEVAEKRAVEAGEHANKADKAREQAERAEEDARAAREAAEQRARELQGRVDELLEQAKQEPIEAECAVMPSEDEIAAIRAEVEAEHRDKLAALEDKLRQAKAGTPQKCSIYFEQTGRSQDDLENALLVLRGEDPGVFEMFAPYVYQAACEFAQRVHEMMEGE